jgi:hypothetical protein
MPFNEPESERLAASPLALILVPLGLILIFAGLCAGGWLLHVAYTALYQPERIPLVGKVLVLLDKDDAILEQVKTEDGVRFEGAAVRYGVLMLLLIVILASIGSVIRAFISAGGSLLQAAGTRSAERPAERSGPRK